MQEAIWQLPFQPSNMNKPYVLPSHTKRFDSAVNHIGWRYMAIVFSLECN